MWYVGIDWADQHHDVVVLDETGHQVGVRHVSHTPEGLTDLTRFLLAVAPTPDQIACVVETNQGLLITALLEAGLPVYPVNPKTVDRRRNAAGAKTDAIDAYLLAKTGRSDLVDLRRLQPDSPLVQELKSLSRLIQMQTRLVNQLTGCLKAYYPVALSLFAKLQQHSTLVFLQQFPTPEAVQAASVEAMIAVLRQAKHPQAAKAAQQIWATVHQPHLTADAITTRTKARLMLALVSQLLPLVEQIAQYDQEITRLFLTHADSGLFKGLPGVGKRLAPRLLAEWGDDRSRLRPVPVCKPWPGRPPWPLPAGTTPRPISATRV